MLPHIISYISCSHTLIDEKKQKLDSYINTANNVDFFYGNVLNIETYTNNKVLHARPVLFHENKLPFPTSHKL